MDHIKYKGAWWNRWMIPYIWYWSGFHCLHPYCMHTIPGPVVLSPLPLSERACSTTAAARKASAALGRWWQYPQIAEACACHTLLSAVYYSCHPAGGASATASLRGGTCL